LKKEVYPTTNEEDDKQASSRKEDHIDLAFKSAVASDLRDERFYYEPMIAGHPDASMDISTDFLGKKLNYPIWISSMTGGTEKAKTINHNLARLCGEYGLGMGLGSCRQLLYEDRRMSEFDIRPLMPSQPLFINLGIAQLESLIADGETDRIDQLIGSLQADGLIIHVNPLQEWLQPEGDRFMKPPIETVETLLRQAKYPIIVKEVGQGFGKESLRLLLQLPLAAIDLAGFGGTNFSKLELLRSDEIEYESYKNMFNIGHTCDEMLDWINDFQTAAPDRIACQKIIISGGVKNFLDGYYFMQKSRISSFYAQASGFLKYAMDYEELEKHLNFQTEGLKMAHACLRIKV
jgi:isopentenyl-diphosphate delta-isomerase